MTEISIDNLLRSKRRTIGFEITNDAKLVVRAPIYVSLGEINNLLIKKANWILEKMNLVSRRNIQYSPKQFINGESFYYLGKPYRFKVMDSDKISLTDYLEFPKALLPYAEKHIVQWYKALAYKKIKERVDYYSQLIGLKYTSIKISDATKRLGSCSSKGSLNFSWRLIMTPLEIIDYVVVHELIHLEEKNHSSKFWSKVRILLPNYMKHKNWLKENGNLLNI